MDRTELKDLRFDEESFQRVQAHLDNIDNPDVSRVRMSDNTTPGLRCVVTKGKPKRFVVEYRIADVRPHVQLPEGISIETARSIARCIRELAAQGADPLMILKISETKERIEDE